MFWGQLFEVDAIGMGSAFRPLPVGVVLMSLVLQPALLADGEFALGQAAP